MKSGKLLPLVRRLTPRLVAATAVGVLILLGGTYFVTRRAMEPPAQHAPVSVLIADFQNGTSDPTLSRTLEPTLKLALEGAGFISAYDRTIINRIGVPAPERLDERAAQEIAVKQGLGVVLAGSISPRGAGYTVSVRATQPVTGELITSAEGVAADKNQVLAVATGLGSNRARGAR